MNVRIVRHAPTKLYPFERFFHGFEAVPTIRELFGPQTRAVLRNLKVEFFSARFGYMSTSDVDGHLIISSQYLRRGEFRSFTGPPFMSSATSGSSVEAAAVLP